MTEDKYSTVPPVGIRIYYRYMGLYETYFIMYGEWPWWPQTMIIYMRHVNE